MLREYAYFDPPAEASRLRALVAALLRACSAALDRLAVRVACDVRADDVLQRLEFYAEAGAPEGALYVNGKLVGTIPGVTRL